MTSSGKASTGYRVATIPESFSCSQIFSMPIKFSLLCYPLERTLIDVKSSGKPGEVLCKQMPRSQAGCPKFFVGQERCDIPPQDREDVFSCVAWNVTSDSSEISKKSEKYAVSVVNEASKRRPNKKGVYHIAFTVHHGIVIRKLGIIHPGSSQAFVVSLFEAQTQTKIAEVLFNGSSDGRLVNGVLYKPIEEYLLPAVNIELKLGFDGAITAESDDPLPLSPSSVIIKDSGGGLIRFHEAAAVSSGHYRDSTAESCLCSFAYRLHDSEKLQKFVEQEAVRSDEWREAGEREQRRIDHEMASYDDIILLPNTMDVYRNIPHKLLHALQWAEENTRVNFVAKTDDDCFLNLFHLLEVVEGQSDRIWLGRFRHNWALDRYGKWAEPSYHSLTYPPFACGSLYVIGKSIVDWLVEGMDTLRLYQGEDVSMGIWMAAIQVEIEDHRKIECEQVCNSDMIASPNWSLDEIQSMWQNWQQCADPCSCS
ncbi:hypothetical protein CAPTEDRAFT_226503 [Capitella teleta]|uniref:Hexosyltransferase n=1 Tax=Capitella teleta TaxID=283909 RepID=R7TJE5_CAPTE|nr:hypothetical protein CAPTEDRAFT_226503 [Capitella teleta]|eukprot:ELT91230.1 hypothetical protein CAPTEDRAFT_226503 [Capitella teleta]